MSRLLSDSEFFTSKSGNDLFAVLFPRSQSLGHSFGEHLLRPVVLAELLAHDDVAVPVVLAAAQFVDASVVGPPAGVVVYPQSPLGSVVTP